MDNTFRYTGRRITEIFRLTLRAGFIRFFDVFNIYAPSANWSINQSFGYSVQNYRIEKALFLICAFAAVYLVFVCFRYRKKLLLVFSAVVGSQLFIIPRPASKVLLEDTFDSKTSAVASDERYYNSVAAKEEKAVFSVESYDMKLDAGRILKAEVKAELSDENLDVYGFTLYHGYRLKSVKDGGGSELEFQQDGDYITVRGTHSPLMKSMSFEYEGSAPRYYSNEQGMCLPGFFPYYPRAGFYKVWDSNESSFAKAYSENPSDFPVKVSSGRKAFSNLNENGTNEFSGTSEAVTVVSGFLRSCVVDGAEVVYPFLDPYEKDESRVAAEVEKLLTDHPEARGRLRKIISIPSINQHSDDEKYRLFSDYMTATQIYMISDAFERVSTPAEKRELYYI